MIRAQSKARARQMREYVKQRQVYLLCHPVCQMHELIWPNDPGLHYAKEIHHTRGRTGALLLEQKWWKGGCRKCHDWVGANPAKARELGLVAPLGSWNQTEKLRQQKERNAAS